MRAHGGALLHMHCVGTHTEQYVLLCHQLQASTERIAAVVQKVCTAVQGLARAADTRDNPLDKVSLRLARLKICMEVTFQHSYLDL